MATKKQVYIAVIGQSNRPHQYPMLTNSSLQALAVLANASSPSCEASPPESRPPS